MPAAKSAARLDRAGFSHAFELAKLDEPSTVPAQKLQ